MNNEKVLSRNKLNRMKYRGRNFGLKQYEVKQLIEHYEEKYRLLKEILNVKDQLISSYNNNVKLPKEVADWLVDKNFTSLTDLEVLLYFKILDDNVEESITSYIMNEDEGMTNIIDAYRYGWEIDEV